MAIKHSLFRLLSLLFASISVACILFIPVTGSVYTKRILGVLAMISVFICFIVSAIWKYQTFLLASRYKVKDVQDERDADMQEYIKYVYWSEIMWAITYALFVGMFVYLITRLFKK